MPKQKWSILSGTSQKPIELVRKTLTFEKNLVVNVIYEKDSSFKAVPTKIIIADKTYEISNFTEFICGETKTFVFVIKGIENLQKVMRTEQGFHILLCD